MAVHYIVLITPEPLDKDLANLWLATASEHLPNGVQSSDNIIVDGHQKQSYFYLKKFGKFGGYVIPLTRDLSVDEAGIIAVAWSKAYTDGDFTVDFSQAAQSKIYKKTIQENVLNEISEQIAKKLHASWLNTKVLEGFNYGPRKDRVLRLDPNLLPWELLNSKVKSEEINRVHKTLEILESINFKIIRV